MTSRTRGRGIVVSSCALAASALMLACGSEADPYTGELTDVSEESPSVGRATSAGEATVEKASFPTTPFEGFDVTCSADEQRQLRDADVSSVGIINDAIDNAQIAEEDYLAGAPFSPITNRFLLVFGDTPEVFRKVIEKLQNVRRVATASQHFCHGEDEPVIRVSGELLTCRERVGLLAATQFAGTPPIRWCPAGLEQSTDERAITMMHEVSHQDRTANFTGDQVIDTNDNGLHNNAHNIARWLRDALFGF